MTKKSFISNLRKKWLLWLITAGIGILFGMIAFYIYYDNAPEHQQTSRFMEFSESKSSIVDLSIENLDLLAQKLTGTASLTIRKGAVSGNWDTVRNSGDVFLLFLQQIESNRYSSVGYSYGGDGFVELSSEELVGDQSFSLDVITLKPIFWYPFDKYKLNANAHLAIRHEEGVKTKSVGTLQIKMLVPNLFLVSSSAYEIELQRSLFLRIVVLIMGVVIPFFVVWCYRSAKSEQLVWQSLAFFTVLWGIRSILLSDIGSSTVVFIDIVTLFTYIVLVAIIIWRWLEYQKSKTPTKPCRFCLSEIPENARRYLYCTSNISSIRLQMTDSVKRPTKVHKHTKFPPIIKT